MLTRSEFLEKLGCKPDPYSKIQALEWLVDNLNGDDSVYLIENICQSWDWQRSKVVSFLDKLQDKKIIAWESSDGVSVRIAFTQGINVTLQKVWH